MSSAAECPEPEDSALGDLQNPDGPESLASCHAMTVRTDSDSLRVNFIGTCSQESNTANETCKEFLLCFLFVVLC